MKYSEPGSASAVGVAVRTVVGVSVGVAVRIDVGVIVVGADVCAVGVAVRTAVGVPVGVSVAATAREPVPRMQTRRHRSVSTGGPSNGLLVRE
jgi:hypothetical protein